MGKWVLLFVLFALGFHAASAQIMTGNALDFDGTNDYVQLGDIDYNHITIEAWIYRRFDSGTWEHIYSDWYDDGEENRAVNCTINTNDELGMAVSTHGGGGAAVEATTIKLNAGQWYHVACTYDGDFMRLFVNGVERASNGALSGNIHNSPRNKRIGVRITGVAVLPFPGVMDEMRIWNVARSQTDIMTNMNATIDPIPAELIAYWKFDQGTAGGNNAGVTNLPDETGNGRNGTLMNFALTGLTSNWINPVTPLPVELADYKAVLLGNSVHLQWQTASETNNYGFEVERQVGASWESLGFVAGHGTTHERQHYTFVDPLYGIEAGYNTIRYRLKQLDLDGASAYSTVLTVPFVFSAQLGQNYPNPFHGATTISYALEQPAFVTLSVYDALGRVIRTMVPAEQAAGRHILRWDGMDNTGRIVPSGTYFYILNVGDQVSASRRMVLQK